MKFCCPLIAVSNIKVSKDFYQKILDQKIILDFGTNVTFDGGFAIQEDFSGLLKIAKESMCQKSHNFELYFEEENLTFFLEKLKKHPEISVLHPVRQYQWGQKVIRIYDPDQHIIEIGESMTSVIQRFYKQGMPFEEISKITMHPIDFVKNCISSK